MTGFTQEYQQEILDYAFPTSGATDHVAYSIDGTTEFEDLERTPVGASGWDDATATTPSSKTNKNKLVSEPATGPGTVTHFAIFDANTGGNQKTDWTALSSSRSVQLGDKLEWDIGSLEVTLD